MNNYSLSVFHKTQNVEFKKFSRLNYKKSDGWKQNDNVDEGKLILYQDITNSV